MKKFSKFEIATIKRTAQSVNPMVSKKSKLKEQIDALQAEYAQLDTMQEQYEASIKTMTGGYGTEDLVEKVIETTGAVDKNGKPIKVTKYEPKAGTVVFNEETNVYEIHTEEPEVEDVAPETVDDTEKAPEVESATFDPTNMGNNSESENKEWV